jgi:hypothetical protein
MIGTLATAKAVIPDVTLTVVSGVLIMADVVADVDGSIPTWITISLGLSVIFLNIARGIGLKDIILKYMEKKYGNKPKKKK